MVMIPTKIPYGSINKSCIAFLSICYGTHLLIDKSSNQWVINKDEFDYLHSQGFQIKEVRRK